MPEIEKRPFPLGTLMPEFREGDWPGVWIVDRFVKQTSGQPQEFTEAEAARALATMLAHKSKVDEAVVNLRAFLRSFGEG